MERRLMLSKQEYREICARYSFEPAWYSRYRQFALEILKMKSKRIVFLGCGRCMIERMLPEEISCVSVDIDEEHIQIGKEVNGGRKNRDIRLMSLYDVREHFSPGSFDAAVISEVIEHVEDDVGALQIAYDMIEPGGFFFLSVPNIDRLSNRISRLIGRAIPTDPGHLREYKYCEIQKMVETARFTILGSQGIYLLLPPEPLSRKIIPVDCSLRNAVKFFPAYGRNIMIVSQKPFDAACSDGMKSQA